jgi:tetratricopeptide (TPR) repeat protein
MSRCYDGSNREQEEGGNRLMLAIEPQVGFSTSDDYLTLFHRYISRSIEAVYARIEPELQELSTEIREQAWHALDYGLKITHGWDGVRKLLLELAPRMEQAGFRHDWLPYLERGVACSRHVQDIAAEAQLSLYMGRLHRLRADLDEARTWLLASATLFEKFDDHQGQATALNQLAHVARLQSHYSEAIAYVDDAMRLLDEQDTERATSLWVLGTIAQAQMQWAEAETHHRAALQIWQEAGNQQRTAWSLQNLGDTLRGAGKYNEAAAYIQQAIVLLGKLHDPVNQAIARMNLGIVHLYSNEPEQALALSTLAEGVFRQVGDQLHLAMVYTNITIAERELGHWHAAEQAGRKSIRLWDALGDRRYMANAMDELGFTYLAQSRHAEAVAVFEEALEMLSQTLPDPFHEMIRTSLQSHLEEAQRVGNV